MTTNNAVNTSLSGQTGTGNFVGSTSPTITTPVILRINDSNGNQSLALPATASAVNYFESQNSATGGNVILSAQGSDTNILLQLIGKGTSGVEIQGATNASSGAAGYVGEVISSTISSGAPVSISNNSAKDLTSINVTAGDWDIYGHVTLLGSTNNLTQGAIWCSLASGTLPDGSLYAGIGSVLAGFIAQNSPFLRVNVSSTTPVYISAYASFGAGTASMSGSIFARRVR